MRIKTLFTLFAVFWVPAGLAAAGEFNVDRDGFMLNGKDAVAYHDDRKPVAGKDRYVTAFRGVKFRFHSAENQKAFEADPERYFPAYGGWCAYGVRVGKKFETDPEVFKFVDGKLYLQLDQGTQKVWLRDVDKNIAIADRLWPRIRTTSPEMLSQ